MSWTAFTAVRSQREERDEDAAALMAKMRIAPEERSRVKLECLRLLATLRLDPAKTQLISGFIDSYLRRNAEEMRAFERDLQTLTPEVKEIAMPLTISWKEEGRAEGRAEGARRTLRLAGEGRLGAPSPTPEARLNVIDSPERLERMARRLFQVETWDELLDDAAQAA